MRRGRKALLPRAGVTPGTSVTGRKERARTRVLLNRRRQRRRGESCTCLCNSLLPFAVGDVLQYVHLLCALAEMVSKQIPVLDAQGLTLMRHLAYNGPEGPQDSPAHTALFQ